MLNLLLMLGVATALLPVNPSCAKEWWHDQFAQEGSGNCESNDSFKAYNSKTAEAWELTCKISKQQKIKGVDAVILDLHCPATDMDPTEMNYRELIIKEQDAIRIYPDGKRYQRCSVLQKPADTCPVTQSIFISESRDNGKYQLLEFPEGAWFGPATITGYVNHKPAWVSKGVASCTNGTVTCSLTLPTMRNGEITQQYRPLVVNNENWVVFAALNASVYLAERQTTYQVDPPYGGLKVELFVDFTPEKDELILPDNVYKFSECKPAPESTQTEH